MRQLRSTLSNLSDADWIYVPDPDAAAIAHSLRGTNVLFDIHEEYHLGRLAHSVPSRLRPASQAAIRHAISGIAKRCTLITAVNERILDAYEAPRGRRQVAFNTPPAWFSPAPPTLEPLEGITRFFHGKALSSNGTGIVLEALRLSVKSGTRARVMMFPSTGSRDETAYDPSFPHTLAALGIREHLDLLDAIPHRAVPSLMSSADVGLIAYDRNLGTGSLPNRFFEYMALGIPVLVPNYATQMRAIVEEHGNGIIADFEDPTSVADAMTLLAGDPAGRHAMGLKGKAAFEQFYAWEPIFNSVRQRMIKAL